MCERAGCHPQLLKAAGYELAEFLTMTWATARSVRARDHHRSREPAHSRYRTQALKLRGPETVGPKSVAIRHRSRPVPAVRERVPFHPDAFDVSALCHGGENSPRWWR